MNKTWLEPILARHLGRVKAPDELWARIQAPGAQAETVAPPAGFGWKLAFAAAGTLALAAGVFWMVHEPRDPIGENETLAARALSGGPEKLDFRSEAAPEVRAWVKSHAGLDVPLPVNTIASVKLLGAHVTPGKNTVEILYQVEGKSAVLTVAKADPEVAGDGAHRFLGGAQRDGARMSSWTMRGQMYTVACPYPQDPRAGCLLCHANGPPGAMLAD
jgi:hypothetical protein